MASLRTAVSVGAAGVAAARVAGSGSGITGVFLLAGRMILRRLFPRDLPGWNVVSFAVKFGMPFHSV